MKLRLGTPDEVGMSSKRTKNIANLAQKWVEQGLTPSLVLVVARRGVVVLHQAFGQLTPAPDSPPLPQDAIFTLCSLSKPVTATAVMALVEDGLIGINRPVMEYIPEFTGPGKQAVLVRHLLTHTSGLTEAVVNPQIDERKLAGVPVPPPTAIQDARVNELLFYGYDAPLSKPPGVEMSYCSYGIDLLGEIVQRVSGKRLEAFARERIFAPLGMNDTWYEVPESVGDRIVRRAPTAPLAGSQSPGWEGMSVYPFRGPKLAWFDSIDCREWEELASGAGGVYSTALDMAKFGQMFLDGGRYGTTLVLSPATVAAMTRNQIPGIGVTVDNIFYPEASWGLGWRAWGNCKMIYSSSLCSPNTFAHGGGGGTRLWIDPENEIVGSYFSVTPRNALVGEYDLCQEDLFMDAVTAAVVDR